MNFRLIGVATLSLLLAGTAMAASSGGHGADREYNELYGRHKMPAQDAIRFGYGNEYPTYHSGWGGLYGDGNHPGSVDHDMGLSIGIGEYSYLHQLGASALRFNPPVPIGRFARGPAGWIGRAISSSTICAVVRERRGCEPADVDRYLPNVLKRKA